MMKNNIELITEKERSDKIFDTLFSLAAEEVMREELDAMPSLEELNKLSLPSPALEKKIRSIIRKEARTTERRKVLKTFYRVAAAIGIVTFLGTAVLMSVEASRNYIINMLIEMREDHVLFEFDQDGTEPEYVFNDMDIIIGYVPDGFVLTNSQDMGLFVFTIFTNADDNQLIIRRNNASIVTIAVDNEVREFTTITFNGQQKHVFDALDSGYESLVIWQSGDDVFRISAPLPIEELLRIAENIQ